MMSIPIRKTRAGLQFTCAAPTLSEAKDVWVCNSDGYVGQVCVMSLRPEPNVTSCNGVCNARILCVASVPAYEAKYVYLYFLKNILLIIINHSILFKRSSDEDTISLPDENISKLQRTTSTNTTTVIQKKEDIQLDSNSSSEDSEIELTLKQRDRHLDPALCTSSTVKVTHITQVS